MATITKRELVNMACAQLDNGCTQADVLEVVQKMVDSITEAVSNGDTEVFRNFAYLTHKIYRNSYIFAHQP